METSVCDVFPDSHRFQPKIRAFQSPADERNIGSDRFVKAILGTSNINLGFGFRYGSSFAAPEISDDAALAVIDKNGDVSR